MIDDGSLKIDAHFVEVDLPDSSNTKPPTRNRSPTKRIVTRSVRRWIFLYTCAFFLFSSTVVDNIVNLLIKLILNENSVLVPLSWNKS